MEVSYMIVIAEEFFALINDGSLPCTELDWEVSMRRQSFERYYLEKIAVGEGCGCAEQALGMRDMDARSQALRLQGQDDPQAGHRFTWLRRLLSWRKTTRSNP